MMKYLLSFLFLYLSSFSAQAQNVTFHGSKHYNIKVNQFNEEGSLPANAIIMLGDSHSEYGENWNRFFPNAKKIINRGIIGDDSRGILKRLNQILPYKPSKIFFECGANDLSHGWSVERTFQGIVNIIETIRRQVPQTKLYVQSLLPLNERVGVWRLLKGKEDMIIQLNNRLKSYCNSQAIPFVDLYTPLLGSHPKAMRTEYCRDGLHLTDKGYEVWANIIRPFINE
ncbi:GDSL-type esterase/lipase family protein [Prevotella fusca]